MQKKYSERFKEEVSDDLNTPQALAIVWEVVKDDTLSGKEKYSLLLDFDLVLGLELDKIKVEKIPSEVLALAEERELARRKKDWKKADELRDKLKQLGYSIGDTSTGFELRKE